MKLGQTNRLWTLLCGLSMTATATAQSAGGGAFIPAGGGVVPKYFAGTLNSISGSLYAFAPPDPEQEVYLTDAWLRLGNLTQGGFTTVKEWHWVAGEPKTVFAALDVVFDSTHFSNGYQLHVNISGTDNLGRPYSKTEVVEVKNKALIGNHSFWNVTYHTYGSQSHDEVQARLDSVAGGSFQVGKYQIKKKLGDDLAIGPWSAELAGANFVWVVSHGSNDLYEMENGVAFFDENGPDPDSHKYVLMNSVGPVFGVWYPPFNVSAVPPLNFMFADTCETLLGDFSQVMWPLQNYYGGTLDLKNMFVAGWKVKMSEANSELTADTLMGYLTSGYPAWKSIQLAMDDWIDADMRDFADNLVSMSMIGKQGDVFTKIAGVYTGSDTQTLGWFR